MFLVFWRNSSEFMENTSIKTLCRVSPTVAGSIRYLKLTSGRSLTVISTGNELIQIMEDEKIRRVLSLGSSVAKILDFIEDMEELWIITKDGRLRTVPLQFSEQRNTESEANVVGDLFDDLFGKVDEEVTVEQNESTSYPILQTCKGDDVVYRESGLCNATVGFNHLVTYSYHESNARIAIYPRTDTKSTEKREFSMRFLHQTMLPKDEFNPGGNIVTSLLYINNPLFKFRRNSLDRSLFSTLFCNQMENNLPVVLFGLQSGLLGYAYVGLDNSKERNTSLKTLYHVEEAVSTIILVQTRSDTSGSFPIADAVCVLGCLGKLVLITQNDSETLSNPVIHRQYHLPGPIVYATMNDRKNTLFYSTLKGLYEVRLESTMDMEDTIPLAPTTLSPMLLDIPDVVALSTYVRDSLLCLTTDGRVLHAPIPSVQQKKQSLCSSGELMKLHMEELHASSMRSEKIREEIQCLDRLIRELNVVTQIFCEILGSRKSYATNISPENGISFCVHADFEANGSSLQPQVILRCQLKNSTKFYFSPHWMMIVETRTSHPWFNRKHCVHSTRSHSVCLSMSVVHDISIRMDHNFSYLSPMYVSCYLCFSLGDLLPVFLKVEETSLADQGFSVHVSTIELDILSFLRKQEPSLVSGPLWQSPTCLLEKTVKSFNGLPQSEQTKMKDSSILHKFSVELSKEAVAFIQNTVVQDWITNSKQNQPEIEDVAPEASVLYFTLCASRTALFNDVSSLSSHVLARTPHEEVVKFQVLGKRTGLELSVLTSHQEIACSVHTALLTVLKPVLQRASETIDENIPVADIQKYLMKLKQLQTTLDLLRPYQTEELFDHDRAQNSLIEKLISIYCELQKFSIIIA